MSQRNWLCLSVNGWLQIPWPRSKDSLRFEDEAFLNYNNPKSDADTERVMCRLKDEGLWLWGWTCPVELIKTLKSWIDQYDEHYLYSALGYKAPRRFDRSITPAT
jgi:hypothetical protein